MQKLIYLCVLLCFFAFQILAKNNREPDSPRGTYKFSLQAIQDTVRAALFKANTEIKLLSDQGIIEAIAQLYFQDYLHKIASYNLHMPQTVDLIESYKTDLVNAFVLKEFKNRYPRLIFDNSKWMFNSVGGIYANMIILYISLDEYIVLWGTTLKADNKFSGYYSYMNEFDVMVRGTMESHDVDAPGHASVIYRPIIQDGIETHTVDTSNLIPKNVRSYNLDAHTYMVSYAQGNILKAFFPGAIMPGIFVNQDWGGLSAHITQSTKAFLKAKKKSKKNKKIISVNYRPIYITDNFKTHMIRDKNKK
jgi:hypothetical protein